MSRVMSLIFALCHDILPSKQANKVCVYQIHSVSFTVAMLNHVVIVEKTSVSTKS